MTSRIRLLLTTSSVAVLALAPTYAPAQAAPSRALFQPVTGAVFAAPGDNRIRSLLAGDIANTPRGATIRAATAITDSSIARLLIAAHKRGVNVRMVLPGNTDRGCSSSASQLLRDARGGLGTNLASRSWVKCVQGSARNTPGAPGHMHMKVWAFSQVGGAREVMVVTSSNTTDNGFKTQYNNAYQTVGWSQLYGAWSVSLFPQLRDDRGGGFWRRTWGAIEAYATPVAAAQDPIRSRVAALPAARTTHIDVAVSVIEAAADKTRAVKIAKQLIAKRKAGATARVVYTRITRGLPRAVAMMCAAGIPVRQFDNIGNRSTRYVHSKYMTASYAAGGAQVHRVWTGSEEWKTESFGQDEFVLRLASRGAYNQYAANFAGLWRAAGKGCP